MELSLDKDGHFSRHQKAYIDQIVEDFGLKDPKISSFALNPNYLKSNEQSDILLNNTLYQKAIGCLLYLAVNTRPDIAASVSILAQKVKQPTTEDWNEVKYEVLRAHQT